MCVAAHRWMKSIELLYCWNLSKCEYGVAAAAAAANAAAAAAGGDGGGAESVCYFTE